MSIASSLPTSMNDADQLALDPAGVVEIAALGSHSAVAGLEVDGTARLSALHLLS